MPNNKNGVLKLVVYVALGCITVGSIAYGLGKGEVDTLKTDIRENTGSIRELEQDSAAVQATLIAIKQQLDRIETKVDKIP